MVVTMMAMTMITVMTLMMVMKEMREAYLGDVNFLRRLKFFYMLLSGLNVSSECC